MLDKKGQLGRIITTFPVMLLVIIIMGIFIFLSFSVAKLKPISIGSASLKLPTGEYSLLLKPIEVKLENSVKAEKMLFFDLIVNRELNPAIVPSSFISPESIEIRNFFKEFSPFLLAGSNNCYGLRKFHYGDNILRKPQYFLSDYYFLIINGNSYAEGGPDQSNEFAKTWSWVSFFLKNVQGNNVLHGVEYYFGECELK